MTFAEYISLRSVGLEAKMRFWLEITWSVVRRVRPDEPFGEVFGEISQRFGVKEWASKFFYQNRAVGWGLTPDDISLEEDGLIFRFYVSLFFEESEMEQNDRWDVNAQESGICDDLV